MNYYFIDYENVHADGFIGIENLGENDTICVMYTEQSKAFSLELVEKITRQRVKLRADRPEQKWQSTAPTARRAASCGWQYETPGRPARRSPACALSNSPV